MPQLNLLQCGICGFAKFGFGSSYTPFIDGATIKYTITGMETTICPECVAHLEARRDMYELTENIKSPCKLRANGEQNNQV